MTNREMMREIKAERDTAAGAALKAAGIMPDDLSVTLDQVVTALSELSPPITANEARYYHSELTIRLRGGPRGDWTLQGHQEPNDD